MVTENITFYDEKLFKFGTLTGEDAQPIANRRMLLVADGLGGSGAIFHREVNEAVFDPQALLTEIFEIPQEEADTSALAAYILSNFAEFYKPPITDGSAFPLNPPLPVREYRPCPDDFKAVLKTKKKSGYYASRMVAALMYKYYTEEKIQAIFDRFHAAESESAVAEEVGQECRDFLLTELDNLAQRAHLINTMKVKNLSLLPTTLVTAFLNEPEGGDFVEAVYLWAGDSRGYVFTPQKGMQQVTADDEENERITNNISLSADFRLNCKLVRFPKPCVLFNATDGFFDIFTANIDSEYYLLQSVAESHDAESLKKNLSEQIFRAVSGGDDSMTFAFALFDCDVPRFAAMAKERLAAIGEEYTRQLSDIFETDYSALVDDARSIVSKLYKKVRAANGEALRSIALQAVQSNGMTEEMQREWNQKIDAAKERKAECVRNAANVFLSYRFADGSFARQRAELLAEEAALRDKNDAALAAMEEKLQDNRNRLQEAMLDLEQCMRNLDTEIFEKLLAHDAEFDRNVLNEYGAKWETLQNLLLENRDVVREQAGEYRKKAFRLGIAGERAKAVREMEKLKRSNKKALYESACAVLCLAKEADKKGSDADTGFRLALSMAESFLTGEAEDTVIPTADEWSDTDAGEAAERFFLARKADVESLFAIRNAYRAAEADIRLAEAAKASVYSEAAERYLNENEEKLCAEYLENDYPQNCDVSEESWKRAKEIIEKYELRERLYEKYDATFLSLADGTGETV